MAYAIKKTPNYYEGTYNSPVENLVTEMDIDYESNDYSIIWFDSKEDAQEFIEDRFNYEEIYYLSYGEASRPSYTVYDEDEEVDCVEPDTPDGFCEIDGDDLPIDVRDVLFNTDVEGDDVRTESTIYRGSICKDGKEYLILYEVKNTALQIHSDDLSCVCWEKEKFFVQID